MKIHLSLNEHKKGNSAYEDYQYWIEESMDEHHQESHISISLNYDGTKPSSSILPRHCNGLNITDENIVCFKDSFLEEFSYITEPQKYQKYATISFIIGCWKMEEGKIKPDIDQEGWQIEYTVTLLPTHNAICIQRGEKVLLNQLPTPNITY